MKRLLLLFAPIFFTLLLFCACSSAPEETAQTSDSTVTTTPESTTTTECLHEWVRVPNLNESTLVEECQKCKETRMTTDPDSLPIRIQFQGPCSVKRATSSWAKEREVSSEALLTLLNQGLWEKDISAVGYDYVFTLDTVSLVYSSATGLFANFAEGRQLPLNESNKKTVNELIASLFETPIPCEATRVWDPFHPDDKGKKGFSFTLPDGVRITYSDDGTDGIYADGELLDIPAWGCFGFYLSDMTRDGYPELCFLTTWGSGIVRETITVFDYTTKTTLFSHGTFNAPLSLFLQDGILCMEDNQSSFVDPSQNVHRTGVFACDGVDVVILWDNEISDSNTIS